MQEVVRVMCPNLKCRRILAVPVTARGKAVRCRGCGAHVKIPDKAIPPAAPKPAETDALVDDKQKPVADGAKP